MPYVDQGEPEPTTLPPILPFIAMAAAMGLSIFLYWFLYENFNLNQWLAPLLTGPIIGASFMLTKVQPVPRAGLIAAVATAITCLAGYVLRHVLWIKWLDPNFKPSVGHAFETLFSYDIMSLLLMGMSAYLAFVIASLSRPVGASNA